MSDYVFEKERRALPWYNSFAIPRAQSSETHCRSPHCPDTNWGGSDRIHQRDSSCPPLEKAGDLSHEKVEWAALAFFEKQAAKQKETAAPSKNFKANNEQIDLILESIDNLADQISRLADIVQTIDLTFNED